MAALTNVRDTSELGGKYIALPVKGATTIYQGAIVAVDANGYAIPGKKAADLKAAGRAEETVENKGGDGDAVIRVSRGTFVFENSTSGKITAADVLGLCYMAVSYTHLALLEILDGLLEGHVLSVEYGLNVVHLPPPSLRGWRRA